MRPSGSALHHAILTTIAARGVAATPFAVRRDDRCWWGPCAWCSLGAAALLADDGRPVTITTTLGAEGEQITVTVTDDDLVDDDYAVHFPVPMRHAWDNVIHTCSVMLLFADVAEVDAFGFTGDTCALGAGTDRF